METKFAGEADQLKYVVDLKMGKNAYSQFQLDHYVSKAATLAESKGVKFVVNIRVTANEGVGKMQQFILGVTESAQRGPFR